MPWSQGALCIDVLLWLEKMSSLTAPTLLHANITRPTGTQNLIITMHSSRTISLKSQNVYGLSKKIIRLRLFHRLIHTNVDIILLQTTHATANPENLWKKDLVGISTSLMEPLPLGEIVFCSRNWIQNSFLAPVMTMAGIQDLEINIVQLILANIYAPNDDNPYFLLDIFQNTDNFPKETKMISWDFKLDLNLDLDKKGRGDETNFKTKEIIKNSWEQKGWANVLRLQHPDGQNTHSIFCRPDFFLISSSLAERITNSKILHGIDWDHSSINFTLRLLEAKLHFIIFCMYRMDYVKYSQKMINKTGHLIKIPIHVLSWMQLNVKFDGKAFHLGHKIEKNEWRNTIFEIKQLMIGTFLATDSPCSVWGRGLTTCSCVMVQF